MEEISPSFFINDSDACLAISCIIIVPEEKKSALLGKINDIHSRYRWIRLYIDKDNTLTAIADVELRHYNAATICYELLCRMVSIIDKCYPELVKYE